MCWNRLAVVVFAMILVFAGVACPAQQDGERIESDRLPHAGARAAAREFEAQLLDLEVRQNVRLAAMLQGVMDDLNHAHDRAVQRGDVSAAAATQQIIQRAQGKIERFSELDDDATFDLADPLITRVLGDDELPATVEPAANGLRRVARRVDDQYLRDKQRLLDTYTEALGDAIRSLLEEEDYEAAQLVEAERDRRQAQIQAIRDYRRSGGWHVVFRSSDPTIWNRDVSESENRFAIDLAPHRRLNGYLRMRRMDTGEYVILRLRTNDVTSNTEVPGGYIWRGSPRHQVRTTNSGNRRENHRFGIVDTSRVREYRTTGGYIISLSGRGRGYGGWGFGKNARVYSDQRYLWGDEEMTEPVVFEIAFKQRALTSEEQAHVLNQ